MLETVKNKILKVVKLTFYNYFLMSKKTRRSSATNFNS